MFVQGSGAFAGAAKAMETSPPNSVSSKLMVLAAGIALAEFAFSDPADPSVPRPTSVVSGTVNGAGPEMLEVQSKSGHSMLRFITNITTDFVDSEDHTLAPEAVKSGIPVTVHYWKCGE